jgi:hypothetical protein
MGFADVTWVWPSNWDHNGKYLVYVDIGRNDGPIGTGDGAPVDESVYTEIEQRSFTVPELDTGTYTIYLKASDEAGNYSSVATHVVEVVPTPTPSYSKSQSHSKSATFSASRSESNSPTWICRAYRFYATGGEQEWEVPGGGEDHITIQLWGAGGEKGRASRSAGSGGYTIVNMKVNPGDKIIVGVGETGKNGTPGYSPGGTAGTAGGFAGAGGGMSAVYFNELKESNLIAIAGGGGGGAESTRYRAGGGAGGGTSGGYGERNNNDRRISPGTQEGGNSKFIGGGGVSDSYGNGGGGGAGYFGGFGGTTHSGADATGAGGSGYINSEIPGLISIMGYHNKTETGEDGSASYRVPKSKMITDKEIGDKRGPSLNLGDPDHDGFVTIYYWCSQPIHTPTPTPSRSMSHSKSISYSKSISISKTPTPSYSRTISISKTPSYSKSASATQSPFNCPQPNVVCHDVLLHLQSNEDDTNNTDIFKDFGFKRNIIKEKEDT